MKFLTIATIKDAFYTLPQAERAKLNMTNYEYVLEFKKKMGDKWHIYGAVGWGRAVSVGEYGSLEEYNQSLQSPAALAGYINYECYPLIELDEKSVKSMIDTLKAAR